MASIPLPSPEESKKYTHPSLMVPTGVFASAMESREPLPTMATPVRLYVIMLPYSSASAYLTNLSALLSPAVFSLRML